MHWYDHEHRHSTLRYVTPAQHHIGEAEAILAQRQRVYQQGKQQHPERWAREIRDFSLPTTLQLNPDKAANC